MSARHQFVLGGLPAGPEHRRRALWVVIISIGVFLLLAPHAQRPLARVPAFVALYQSALATLDFVTAILLIDHFRLFKLTRLLSLGCGYLFTGVMALLHMATFPGLFADTGLLGAGQQTTAWMYMLWHGGFPLFVLAYAALGTRKVEGRNLGDWPHIVAGLALVGALACGSVLLATAGEDLLPPIMAGHSYTARMGPVVLATWALSVVALCAVWYRRQSVLDYWLVVVMAAWLIDIALAAVLNQGRFDLGFYAGRLYGLLAAGVVLAGLLIENGALQRRLIQAHDEALANARAKDRFVAMVAHELRNPLAAISNGVHALGRSLKPEESREVLGLVRRQVGHLQRLVEDLVNAGRVAAGLVEVRPVACDLAQVARQAMAVLDAAGRLKAHRLVVSLEEVQVLADVERIEQVVGNIVSNAAKFTPPGKQIEVRVAKENGRALLQVCDQGIGMPVEEVERVFDWFYQGDAVVRSPGGLGLGLALARALVELHGGSMEVQSGGRGRGTCVRVWLPVPDMAATAGLAVRRPELEQR